MLTRKKLINDKKQIKSYLTVRETPTSSASIELEEVGYTILRNIFNKDELEALRKKSLRFMRKKNLIFVTQTNLTMICVLHFVMRCLTTVHCLNQLCHAEKFLT